MEAHRDQSFIDSRTHDSGGRPTEARWERVTVLGTPDETLHVRKPIEVCEGE